MLGKDFVSTIEWPDHFKQLQKTFTALNTVYTFLSTRKHLASTFDNLKSSVENITKRCVGCVESRRQHIARASPNLYFLRRHHPHIALD